MENRGKVGVEDFVPVARGDLVHGENRGVTGAVDDDVEPAEGIERRGDSVLDRDGLGDVGGNREALAGEALGFIQIGSRARKQREPMGGREFHRDGPADASPRAGDDGDGIVHWMIAVMVCD